jgi:N-acetylglucosaminyldiphosphoundecaprenol N-acetyl-beta-D-mannosaminyltransferase
VEPRVNAPPALPEVEVPAVGVTVHDLTPAHAVELIIRWAREGSGGYVSTPNVDHLVRARRDPEFRKLVLGARLRLPDGMGLVYGSRLAGRAVRGAVHGRLLPEAIVRATTEDPVPIGLLGGRDDAPQQAAARLRELGGTVVAAVSPPMGFEIGGAADEEATRELVAAGPRILVVGFGAPKQEQWMARHAADLPHTVMLGLGQTVDVLGGRVPAAPGWMTRVGLEWFFRLLRDPRRIGRRVFIDDPPFFWWMLRARLRGR